MKFIAVKLVKEAFHKYKDAPEDVSFLRNLHRHLFYIEVKISITHNDRELEFFQVKRVLNDYLDEYLKKTNKIVGSCEMWGEDINTFLNKEYPNRKYKVSVFEDNENGMTIE